MGGEQWKDPYLRQDRGDWDRYREWNRMKEGNRRHDVSSWSQKIEQYKFLESLYIPKKKSASIEGVEGYHSVLNWTPFIHKRDLGP